MCSLKHFHHPAFGGEETAVTVLETYFDSHVFQVASNTAVRRLDAVSSVRRP